MESNQNTVNGNVLEANVSLINNKLHFLGKSGNNEPVHIDYIAPLGDNEGYMSLQLFLLSLASCAGSSVLTFLRRMRKTIDGCQIKATGIRRSEHPLSFEKVTLEFMVRSTDILEADLQKVIDLSEATYCPVWAMIKGNVEVETRITILN
jgi:putative redox protein